MASPKKSDPSETPIAAEPAAAFTALMESLQSEQRETVIDECMRRLNLAVSEAQVEATATFETQNNQLIAERDAALKALKAGGGALAPEDDPAWVADRDGMRTNVIAIDCSQDTLGDAIRAAVSCVQGWRADRWGYATRDLPLRLEITIGDPEWRDRGPKVERAIHEALKVHVAVRMVPAGG